jgi:predicted nucleic acid-binding protein
LIPQDALVVLDTGVLVHLIRDSALGKWLEEQYLLGARTDRPLISIVSVGEILSLARQFDWGPDKVGIMTDLVRQLVVVDISTSNVLELYAEIDSYSRAEGRPMGKNDAWIAATAKAADAWLLTLDKDFDHLDPSHIRREWVDESSGS